MLIGYFAGFVIAEQVIQFLQDGFFIEVLFVFFIQPLTVAVAANVQVIKLSLIHI